MQEKNGYQNYIETTKKQLKRKVTSIFILSDPEKERLQNALDKVNDLDKLHYYEYRINSILRKCWEAAVKLIDKCDDEELNNIKSIMEKEIIQNINNEQKEYQEEVENLKNQINI